MGATVGQLGEFPLIERIRRIATGEGAAPAGVTLGIGDDAAVLKLQPGWELLVTCDVQVEGRHYLPGFTCPVDLGRRAMTVNLSDIGAMGGVALYALVSLGLRRNTLVTEVEDLYRGFSEALAPHRVAVVGGNLSQVEGAQFIDITLLGQVEAGRAVRRSGARPGDAILASGYPGQAAVGLRILQAAPDRRAVEEDPLVQAYLRPAARLHEARLLAATGRLTAMIDTSDGFLADLGHVCADSGVGARLEAANLPLSPALRRAAQRWHEDPVTLSLQPSDDYELVLTCPPEAAEQLRQVWTRASQAPLAAVGKVTETAGRLELVRPDGSTRRLEGRGWDHFA